MTTATTTRAYVEGELGIPWATWAAMETADRHEAISGRPAPEYLRVPAGPARLAAFHAALRRSAR